MNKFVRISNHLDTGFRNATRLHTQALTPTTPNDHQIQNNIKMSLDGKRNIATVRMTDAMKNPMQANIAFVIMNVPNLSSESVWADHVRNLFIAVPPLRWSTAPTGLTRKRFLPLDERVVSPLDKKGSRRTAPEIRRRVLNEFDEVAAEGRQLQGMRKRWVARS